MKIVNINSCKDKYGHTINIGDPVLYVEQWSKSSPPLICKANVLSFYVMQKREYVKLDTGAISLAKYVVLDFEVLYRQYRLELTQTFNNYDL